MTQKDETNQLPIYQTTDYDKFKFLPYNRSLSLSRVKKLAAEIKENNLLSIEPIICTENFEVIDGQHRLLAAKSLQTDIYYRIYPNFMHQNLITLNNRRANWTLEDYTNYYIHHGKEDYHKLSEFAKDFNLPVGIAKRWLTS